MKANKTNINLLLTAILGCIGFIVNKYVHNTENVDHHITIHHPGMQEDKDCLLVEVQDELGKTTAFYMDVKSVICLDGECKIVDVRLLWDRLGDYTKYELADGVELEKKDGAPFTNGDYDKLHEILLDKRSIFDGIALGEVVDIKKNNAGIDGISGATVLTDENASVKGAAWTCYTLWHWANGEVTQFIAKLTKSSASSKDLYSFYSDERKNYKIFAAELFLQRKMYDVNTLDLVTNSFLRLDVEPSKKTIQYLKSAPFSVLASSLQFFYPKATERQRILLLKALLDEEYLHLDEFTSLLRDIIPQLLAYQEINLVADYLQENQVDSTKVNEALMPFLSKKDFISARRIYWLLKEKQLSDEAHIRLKQFEKKHKDSL